MISMISMTSMMVLCDGTHRHIFDGSRHEQEENRTGCLGSAQQKKLRVKFLLGRSSNFSGSSDQDHPRRGQGFEPVGEDHQKKGKWRGKDVADQEEQSASRIWKAK